DTEPEPALGVGEHITRAGESLAGQDTGEEGRTGPARRPHGRQPDESGISEQEGGTDSPGAGEPGDQGGRGADPHRRTARSSNLRRTRRSSDPVGPLHRIRAAATAAWPRLMPPSLVGTRECVSTRNPAPSRPATAVASSSTFCHTPPESATVVSPVAARARSQPATT